MHLWYAAYGSNMDADRLGYYVGGGRPPGAARTYPGARDRTLPTDRRPVALAGSVYFAWESPTWGGGIAFYDPDAPGRSVGVAHRLTLGQFSDLAAMEMHRDPTGDLELADLWRSGRLVLGPGRYESLHVVGELDGEPVATFTESWPPDRAPLNPPVPAILRLMARGLTAAHGWSTDQVVGYLLARPGIGPDWDHARLRALLDPRR